MCKVIRLTTKGRKEKTYTDRHLYRKNKICTQVQQILMTSTNMPAVNQNNITKTT